MRSTTARNCARWRSRVVAVALGVVAQELEVADDRRQRRAQLVGDERRELVLHALRLAPGGHVAEDDDPPVQADLDLLEARDVAGEDPAAAGVLDLVADDLLGDVGDRPLAEQRQHLAHRLVGDDRVAAVVEQRDRVRRGVQDGARDRVAPAQLAQHDRLGEGDSRLVGEVRDEHDVAARQRHVREPAEAEHAEDLARLEQRDVELVRDRRRARRASAGACPRRWAPRHRAQLDGRAPGEPVAGQHDLGQARRVDAARGRDREVAAAARVANVERARLAAHGVGDAVEDGCASGAKPASAATASPNALVISTRVFSASSAAIVRSSSPRWASSSSA